MNEELPEFNINELQDGDIVIYEDRDREVKHNTNKVHTNPRMIGNGKLDKDVPLKSFTHVLTTEMGNKFKLFIINLYDEQYDIFKKKDK